MKKMRVVKIAIVVTVAIGSLAALDASFASTVPSTQPIQLWQEPDSTAQAPEATPIAPIGLLSPTVQITETGQITEQELITTTAETENRQPTPTDSQTAQPITSTEANTEAKPLSGTIISNRTNFAARFFVEGQTYRIDPFASDGIEVPRITAVLNLYTCDADTPESVAGCYWDPYIMQQDGFYEITDESAVVGLPALVLQRADAPPNDQVWIHNRSGQTESLVFRDIVYEVEPGQVQELAVEAGAPVIVYVRSCASIETDEVCEWAPQSLEAGAYFAMVESSTPGVIPGSRVTTVNLQPVVDSDGQAVPTPDEVTCQLIVPALNIRSGPGLQYEIIGKVRVSEEDPGRIAVAGRSADGYWYSLSETTMADGWVTSNADFITCRGNTSELPIVEFSSAPLTPIVETPTQPSASVAEQPVVEQEPTAAASEVDAESNAEAETEPEPEEPQAPAIPEGQALIAVTNGFEFPIRFTIDQQFRPIEGPSEYDLEPEESVSIVTFAGPISFSASTAWNSLSGNTGIEVPADDVTSLWLRFEPDPDGSNQWDLAWD